MNGRTRLMGLVLVLALAACSSAGSTISPPGPSAGQDADRAPTPSTPGASITVAVASPSPTQPAAPSQPATPRPTATVEPTPRPSPASTASTAPPPVAFKPGQVAIVTATEGVRMRTQPRVDDGSDRYKPMLPKGTDLYVISGPKHGSGYHWYEVSPVTFQVTGLVEWPETIVGPGSTGWVAVASRDGEPWLAHGKATCPDKPKDVMTLVRLSVGARIGCFSRVPIKVRARILPCNCDVDPAL